MYSFLLPVSRSAAPEYGNVPGMSYLTEKLMDLKVVSTLGLTEEDLLELEKTKGIEKAEGAYMTDVLCGEGDNQRFCIWSPLQRIFRSFRPMRGRFRQKPMNVFWMPRRHRPLISMWEIPSPYRRRERKVILF